MVAEAEVVVQQSIPVLDHVEYRGTGATSSNLQEGSPSCEPSCSSGILLSKDIGPRRYMEDEHIRIDDLSTHLGSFFGFPKPSAFYGVFDGHGGPEAAAYVRKNVLRLLFEDAKFPQASIVDAAFLVDVENSLRKAFLSADLALADDCSVSSSSETTTLIALIFGR